jgi:RHS repeat-associated protein
VSDPTGVRYQFSAAGTLSGSKTYNPYGKCTTCTATTPFGFEDGYTDPNGLLYLVHRYYDPQTGQFLTVDPLVSITGQPFGYANDDPVNGSDPSGDSGNEVDLMCSGGGYHPGESVAQACAYAEANAKQVTSSECSNDGSCGNSGCGKFGIKCWYPLIPFAVVLCVAGGCEAALGAIGAGTAATAIVDACAATGGGCTAAGLYLASKAAEGQAEADANACSNPYEKAFYQGVANSIQDVDLTHLAKELSEL